MPFDATPQKILDVALDDLIAWLETMPASEQYAAHRPWKCLWGQYAGVLGTQYPVNADEMPLSRISVKLSWQPHCLRRLTKRSAATIFQRRDFRHRPKSEGAPNRAPLLPAGPESLPARNHGPTRLGVALAGPATPEGGLEAQRPVVLIRAPRMTAPDDRIAPAGAIWVCGACGKMARDQYGIKGAHSYGWDESCVFNSVLCRDDETMVKENGRIVKAQPFTP